MRKRREEPTSGKKPGRIGSLRRHGMHRMHQMNSRPCQSQESPGRSLPMHGVTHGSLTNAQRRSDNCYECTHPCTALSAARSRMQWQIAISLVHQSLHREKTFHAQRDHLHAERGSLHILAQARSGSLTKSVLTLLAVLAQEFRVRLPMK